MASLNKVFLMGNLTRDPELRYTTGGAAVCKFGLAVNQRYQTSKGEDREEVCFVDVDVWGKPAEACEHYLRKGAPALVEGRLRFEQWDDRDTGKKRSRLTVRGDRVQFIGAPSRDSDAYSEENPPAAPAPAPAQPARAQAAAAPAPEASGTAMPEFQPVDEGADDDIPF